MNELIIYGVEKVDYISKTGTPVNGFNFYVGGTSKNTIVGNTVEKIYVSKRTLENSGFKADVIPELMPDSSTIQVLYNKYGKPECIQLNK